MSPSIVVTVYSGMYGQDVQQIAINLDGDLYNALAGRVERDTGNLFTQMVSSAATLREMRVRPTIRKEQAEKLGRLLAEGIVKAFQSKDTFAGYDISKMSKEERAHHIKQGRLPSDYLNLDQAG